MALDVAIEGVPIEELSCLHKYVLTDDCAQIVGRQADFRRPRLPMLELQVVPTGINDELALNWLIRERRRLGPDWERQHNRGSQVERHCTYRVP